MDVLNDMSLWGNSPAQWLRGLGVAAVIAGAAWTALRIVVRRLRRVAKRTDTQLDDILVRMLSATRWTTFAALGLLVLARIVHLPDLARLRVDQAVLIFWLLQVGTWGATAFEAWIELRRDSADAAARTAMGALRFVVRTAIWATVLLLILDNLGVDITALVTGLGIGGIAIGLALQNILGDLFASLSIVLDKPFVVGDYIVVDTMSGDVEYIGVKSTRIRSLSGEQIIFGNSDLLKSRIRNFKRMQERRHLFRFGVEYGTPPQALRAIPGWVKAIIDEQPLARLDRVHFAEFGASSLDFEVVYFCKDPTFKALMDTQQSINFALFEKLAAEGVAFAFPTRTLHIVQSGEAKDS